jgi:hypothetical protein
MILKCGNFENEMIKSKRMGGVCNKHGEMRNP